MAAAKSNPLIAFAFEQTQNFSFIISYFKNLAI